MILNGNLYNITGREEIQGGTSYTIRVNPGHFVYKAHFPEEPVTPGVCILQIATEMLQEESKMKLSLKKVKNAKFTAVLSPRDSCEITVTFSKMAWRDNEISSQCVIFNKNNGTVYAKLSFSCMKNG